MCRILSTIQGYWRVSTEIIFLNTGASIDKTISRSSRLEGRWAWTEAWGSWIRASYVYTCINLTIAITSLPASSSNNIFYPFHSIHGTSLRNDVLNTYSSKIVKSSNQAGIDSWISRLSKWNKLWQNYPRTWRIHITIGLLRNCPRWLILSSHDRGRELEWSNHRKQLE